MEMFLMKRTARKEMNQIDKILCQINEVAQSEIDRACDKIDSELNSCKRECEGAIKTLEQIRPLIDKLAVQVGENAPEHLKVLVQSICQEIMSKTTTSIGNLREVQKNVDDVDKHTDAIDSYTDEIKNLTMKIDALTDTFQS